MSNNSTKMILKSVEDIYLKGEYQEAVDLLIKSKGSLPDGLFHYNLGTLYLKMNKIGPSRYNLEKAKKIGFSNNMVANNISYIRENSSAIDANGEGLWVDISLQRFMDLPIYQFSFILLLLACFLCILTRLRKIRLRTFFLSLIFIGIMPLALRLFVAESYQNAIVMNDVSVYEGPSKIYEETSKLIAGSKVLVGKKQNDWLYISSPSSVSGWVKRSDLGFY